MGFDWGKGRRMVFNVTISIITLSMRLFRIEYNNHFYVYINTLENLINCIRFSFRGGFVKHSLPVRPSALTPHLRYHFSFAFLSTKNMKVGYRDQSCIYTFNRFNFQISNFQLNAAMTGKHNVSSFIFEIVLR